jgi:FkbH-like protein
MSSQVFVGTGAGRAPSDLRTLATSFERVADWAECNERVQALDRWGAAGIPEATRVRIAVAASSNMTPFADFLRIEAARFGFWADVYLCDYGQYLQEMLDIESALHRHQPHLTFVMVEGEVLREAHWRADQARESADAGQQLTADLIQGCRQLMEHSGSVIVLNELVLSYSPQEGFDAFRSDTSLRRSVTQSNDTLSRALAEMPSAVLFPLRDVVASLGLSHAFCRRSHYRGHVTWSDHLMASVARRYAAIVASSRGRAVKCIVLDLDNTLWGGVLGEDGPSALSIGQTWPGREYWDFQRELLELQRRGILLALCSKNVEADALAILRDHPGMLIREQHVAAHRINWIDKATNIAAIAAELNIGLDTIVFLDDSAHEREWARSQLPDVLVPDFPDDPSELAPWLGELPLPLPLQHTAEDQARTLQYQQARLRAESERHAASREDFLRGLHIDVTVEPMNDASAPRAAQLLSKTNQFNLTTRRHDEATLRRRMALREWQVVLLRATDRVGDYGLTAIAVIVTSGTAWHVDSFAVSCRVLGKGIETAFLSALVQQAKSAGVAMLTAEFLPTPRNVVASNFLAESGFTAAAPDRWHLDLATRQVACPEWIALHAESRLPFTPTLGDRP